MSLERLPQAREEISPFAPRILTIQINKDKIRDIIGPGGKMIRSITERTGCKIEIHDEAFSTEQDWDALAEP